MSKLKTILVIDDELDLTEILKVKLESEGYSVLMAHNGREGLEHLKKFQVDLIILDINMPEMGGIEFYKKTLDEEGNSKYPIIVLTARDNLEDTFKDFKVEGFFSKPFEISKLVDEVKKIVK